MTASLDISSRLLDMVASKFGYDYILLRSGLGVRNAKPKSCYAAFGQHGSYRTSYVRANGKAVWIVSIDDNCNAISNSCIYAELVKTLYKTLERNGIISDGAHEHVIDADDVPEFMIECVLNGYA